MTTKEQDSGVEVVSGCFTERGDSILSVFSWEFFGVFANKAAIRINTKFLRFTVVFLLREKFADMMPYLIILH